MLTTTGASRTASRCSPVRSASVESKTNRGTPWGSGSRLTRSMPGRNHQAPGTGREETTGTRLPRGSSAWASPSAEPRVSPSASLWVTAPSTGCRSTTFQMAGATASTSPRGGDRGGLLPIPRRFLLGDLPQQLADPHAVSDAPIQLEAQLGSEAQVGQPDADLPPDEAPGVAQPLDGRFLLLRLPHHADLHGRIAQIGRELHIADAGHCDARVLEVPDDDLADLLAELGGDALHSMRAHGPILSQRITLPASGGR